MRHISILLMFLCLVCFTACDQSSHEVYHLLQTERIIESDTTKAIELLCRIPEEIFRDPYFSQVHNVSCIENVYYSKIIHEIERGDIKEAQNIVGDFIKVLMVYNYRDKDLLSNCEDSKIIDTSLLIYNNLALINTSSKSDSLILETKRLLEQRIYQQINTHWKEETLFIEYRLLNNKYYYYALLIISIILFFFVYHQYKTSESLNLCLKMYKKEDEVKYLSQQLKMYQENTTLHLGIGKRIYESIINGGTMKNISIENEKYFIDYYAFRYPQDYKEIVSNYKSLSLRHTSYLILKKMEFLDNDIKRILFVQDSTIRNYRLRIKKRLK